MARTQHAVRRLHLTWALVALSFSALPASGQEASLEGHWEGIIEIPGTPLEVDVDFTLEDGGWTGDISIPAQNAKDLPLEEIRLDGLEATFSIVGIPGGPTFSGRIAEDGSEITGDFTQGGQSFSFTLAGAE